MKESVRHVSRIELENTKIEADSVTEQFEISMQMGKDGRDEAV